MSAPIAYLYIILCVAGASVAFGVAADKVLIGMGVWFALMSLMLAMLASAS